MGDEDWEKSMKKIAWFNDIITFWQLWKTLDISKLEKFFFNKDLMNLPIYGIAVFNGDQKRISSLSLFQSGIQPMTEDPKNIQGCEFRFTITLNQSWAARSETPIDINGSAVNKVWEDIVVDLITKKLPHADQVTGIRLSDKSRNDFTVRLDIWLLFSDGDKDPRGMQMKEYITKDIIEKHKLPTPDV